jgi:tripartite-type tricarboxylate transporter receptor subunit TctC
MHPRALRMGLLLILGLAPGLGAAESPGLSSWPVRALSIITPAPPGGAVDLTARTIGDKLAERLGRPVVVDSRPGADGIVAAEAFLGAKDKDHTFLVTFGGLLINNPVNYDKLPYDAERDFVPVAMLAVDTIVICANSAVDANDMAGLIRLMRESPGTVRWASAPGEPRLRFFGVLKEADARPLYVPYKTTSQAVIDLIAGRIEIMVAPLASVLPNVRAGRLKLLTVMATQRSPAIPNVPSVEEAGFTRLAMLPFIGLFARSGTQSEIVERLNREINAALADTAARRHLEEAGLRPTPGTPAELAAVVASKLQENRELARLVGPIRQ